MKIITINRAVVEQALDDLRDLHANHNITYAGTISRLEAALVLAQAEPVATSAENATTEQQVSKTPPSDYRRSYLDGYFDGFAIGKREGRIEAEDVAKQAEPVQEPVAWRYELATTIHENEYGGWEQLITAYKPNVPEGSIRNLSPLYTTPPKTEPLTDEEIIDATEHIDTSRNGYFIDIARAIERAHNRRLT